MAILQMIWGVLSKVLPFLLVYKAGGDRVEKNNLEATVKEGEIRNEIESEANDLSRVELINRLHKLKDDK